MISNILEKKTLRLDIYLYYIRIFKSRSIATKFVLTNRLRISGQVTQKPHKMISIGDILTMTINDNIKILIDGKLSNTKSITGYTNYYSDDFILGARHEVETRRYKGNISEILVFDKEVDATEIVELNYYLSKH